MVEKRVLVPDRVRRIAGGFSWIDRRLIRERVILRLSGNDILLYFFLVAVADAKGLSFWADPTVAELLHMGEGEVAIARARLVHFDLIAYDYPLYQVLSLPAAPAAEGAARA